MKNRYIFLMIVHCLFLAAMAVSLTLVHHPWAPFLILLGFAWGYLLTWK